MNLIRSETHRENYKKKTPGTVGLFVKNANARRLFNEESV